MLIKTATALQVENLTRRFGALTAVSNVNLTVQQGARQAIIGPNGAGKTTFFNLLSGALAPSSGTIRLNGQNITKLPDWKRTRLGLSRTFQRNNLFMGLTTFENVRLGIQRQQNLSYNMLKPVRALAQVNAQAEQVLERVRLVARKHTPVATLSYGEQRQLEIALALTTEPHILLLDEPTAGMSVAETTQMTKLIKDLPASLTLLIVEHDMDVVFAIADQITVLHLGQVLTEGTPEAVRADGRVRQVYFGEE